MILIKFIFGKLYLLFIFGKLYDKNQTKIISIGVSEYLKVRKRNVAIKLINIVIFIVKNHESQLIYERILYLLDSLGLYIGDCDHSAKQFKSLLAIIVKHIYKSYSN